MSQRDKALTFQALHQQPGCFVIPNPWDAGSARLLTAQGFQCLATTSAGLAFSLGKRDAEGALSRDEILLNARAIVEATDLPVSADLENGFGDDEDSVADTIRQAAACGLVGGSIEDATGRAAFPIYDFDHAVRRVKAAAEAARSLPFPFTLTARAENYLNGRNDLEDTIRRLQAFADAGADVLFAPGLPDLEAIRMVCSSLSKPVNVVMGLSGKSYRLDELADAGVRRVSLGSSLARTALGAMMDAAREIKESGRFSRTESAIPFSMINDQMRST